MRLIDADEMAINESEAYMKVNAREDIDPRTREANYLVHWKIQRLIADTPTVDAVPVVRCKNCTWNDWARCMNPKCGKSWYGCPVPNEHYCSYGERRCE